MSLGIPQEQLNTCVSCGLCLPHCPTFRVTGEEWASPRGRIAAMREVQEQGAPMDAVFRASMNSCVQCRGCEPACPSAVPFGAMMETTLAHSGPVGGVWRRVGLRLLGRPRLLQLGSRLLAVAQRLRLVPSRRLGLPRLPLRQPRLKASAQPDTTSPADPLTQVVLFTGCVMDAWQRDVHAATQRVLETTGTRVGLAPRGASCCGALSLHAGMEQHARKLARRTVAAFAQDESPVLVNSAGCGAMLKDLGKLLGTPEAAAFSARVRDVHEWLAEHPDALPDAPTTTDARGKGPVAVHDPCHLRHVQRAHAPVHEVLGRFVPVVPLDDDGLCCGAGGAYASLQPELAARIRDRKLEAIRRSGAKLVASANPGCTFHLMGGGVTVRHPIQIIDEELCRGG